VSNGVGKGNVISLSPANYASGKLTTVSFPWSKMNPVRFYFFSLTKQKHGETTALPLKSKKLSLLRNNIALNVVFKACRHNFSIRAL